MALLPILLRPSSVVHCLCHVAGRRAWRHSAALGGLHGGQFVPRCKTGRTVAAQLAIRRKSRAGRKSHRAERSRNR